MGIQDEGADSKPGITSNAPAPGSATETIFSDLLAELETQADAGPADLAPASGKTSKVLLCTAALESIGHLRKGVESLWGSPELDLFINRLFVDSRDGGRHGLPLAVAAELLFLAKTNKMIRALDTAKRLELSLPDAYRLVDAGDQSRLQADQHPGPEQGNLIFVSRREESTDGFLTRFWRHRSRFYLMLAALGGTLWWLWIHGLIPGFSD